MKLRIAILLACVVISLSCGGSHHAVSGVLTGNWQFTLQRHGVIAPASYTGFLVQSGSTVTGTLILGGGCGGVGPVRGTLNGQDVTLTVNEFGQDLSLSGTLASDSTMGGQFSSLAGSCTTPFTTTGTWAAIPIPPLPGNFTGTLTSKVTNVSTQLSGTLSQGPNTGDSTAPLSGTVTSATGGSTFCPLLSTAAITGLISGETVTLNLYAPNGSWIAQVAGSIQLPPPATTMPTTLIGTYNFQQAPGSCGVDNGTLQLTFQ